MTRSGKKMKPITRKSMKGHDARFAETAGRYMEEVKRRMARRRWSGAELARRMGISRAAVSRILTPGANPTLRTMTALAAALDVDIEVVFHRPRPFSGLPPGLKPVLIPPQRV